MKKNKYILICLLTINLNFSYAQLSLTVFHDSLLPRANSMMADEISDIEYHDDHAYFSSFFGVLHRTSLTSQNSVIETLHTGAFNRLSGLSISGNQLYLLESSDAQSPDSIGTQNSGKLYSIDLSSPNFTLTELRDSLNFPSEIEIVDNIAYIVENDLDSLGYLLGSSMSITDLSTINTPVITIYNSLNSAITDLEFYSDFMFFNESGIGNFDKRIAKIDLLNSYSVQNQFVYDNQDYNFLKGVIRNGTYYLTNTNSLSSPESIYSLDLSDTLSIPVLTVAPPSYPGNHTSIELFELTVGPLDNLFCVATILYTDFSTPTVPLIETQTILFNLNESALSVSENSDVDEEILLYPNPAQDYIMIKNIDSKVDYVIFSITGKFCQSGKISSDEKIDLENLKNGQYIIRTENSARFFIKQ